MLQEENAMNKLKSLIVFLALVVIGTSWMPVSVASSQATFSAVSSPVAGPWYVAIGGNDSNSCSSPAAPCATINGAIGKASPGDTVYVAEGTYTSEESEVVLINKDVSLSGGWDDSFSNQVGYATIDGRTSRSGMLAVSGVTAAIDRFVIRRGVGDPDNYTYGGISIHQATLTVDNSIIQDNRYGHGVGIGLQEGHLTLNNSAISDNDSQGIANYSGNVVMNNSTVVHNAVVGVLNYGSMILNNSTVSHNHHTGYVGGGIVNGGDLALNNSTVSENTAAQGGGIASYGGTITIQNTIIAGNSAEAHPNCSANFTSAGYNLIGDADGCNFTPAAGDLTDVSPEMGPLIGAPKIPRYYPLLPGSPAIDAGNPTGCTGSTGDLLTDQRGASRVGTCDIGAYEYTAPGAPAAVIVYSGSDQYALPGEPFEIPLVASVLDSLGTPVEGITVTFSAPASEASGTFADTGGITTTAQTISSSFATADLFTANGITGGYTVAASVDGVTNLALFHLRNGSGALYVSPDGDDVNTCFEPAHPCATLFETKEKVGVGKTIYVAQGVYTSTFPEVLYIDKDFTLSGGWDSAFSSQRGTSTLDGENTRRGVSVWEGVTATLDHITVQQAYETGIYNQGTLSMTHVTLSGNQGSGLSNLSNVDIQDSIVRGNSNGGIYNAGLLTMYNSSVIENTTDGSGGGIFNLENFGAANINNSTISLNSASLNGGGVSNGPNQDSLSLNNSTVSKNSAGYDGGGLYGWASLKNTILADNEASDCYFALSGGYNLIADIAGCQYYPATGDIVNTDARLSPYTDPSGVQLLWRDSPAIDAGNPGGCTDHEGNPLDADQRGVARLGRCDIGAYEYDPAFDPISYISLPVAFKNQCSDFFDDFSDPNSGWYTGETDTGRVEYLDGEYSVLVNPESWSWMLGSPACDQVNYSVEADARWSDRTGASYGLVFGIQGDFERFYSFEVNTDYQEFILYRYDPGGWTEIAPVTYSSAIHPEAETNHLKATRNGDSITLEVNGTVLGTWNDSAITGSSFSGLIVTTYSDQENAEARFDNYKITGLGSSGAAADLMDEVLQPLHFEKAYRQVSWR
jgi:hypothetical protein